MTGQLVGAEGSDAVGAPDHPPTEPTVLASWTATVVRALDERGIDGAALARQAGIDPATFEVDGARLPLSATSRLWREAVEATGDECFGLHVARFVRPSTFHGLSVGVVASDRFRDALERMVRFAAVVCRPSLLTTLDARDGNYEYITIPVHEVAQPSHESMEAILACIVRAGRFLMGRGLTAVSVELMRPTRPERSRFEDFFGCPVHYGSHRYALTFPGEVVDRPLTTGCDEVARTADHVVSAYLDRVSPGGVITEQVRDAVAALLPDDALSSAAVASRLAISERTMQRRLRDEGTTFREVVADVRIALTKQAISAGERRLETVAVRLGFSDVTALRRAFKRHTGMTPGQYADACRTPP